MPTTYSKNKLKELITGKLHRNFGRELSEATQAHMFKACALVLRDIMSTRKIESLDRAAEMQARQVHYLSLEFLMGRSLMKNAYNLGVLDELTAAVEEMGFSAADLSQSRSNHQRSCGKG